MAPTHVDPLPGTSDLTLFSSSTALPVPGPATCGIAWPTNSCASMSAGGSLKGLPAVSVNPLTLGQKLSPIGLRRLDGQQSHRLQHLCRRFLFHLFAVLKGRSDSDADSIFASDPCVQPLCIVARELSSAANLHQLAALYLTCRCPVRDC